MICYTALLQQYLTDALPFPCFLPPLSVYLLSFLLCLLSKDFFFKNFIGVQLIYNVVSVPGYSKVNQLYIYIQLSKYFSLKNQLLISQTEFQLHTFSFQIYTHTHIHTHIYMAFNSLSLFKNKEFTIRISGISNQVRKAFMEWKRFYRFLISHFSQPRLKQTPTNS